MRTISFRIPDSTYKRMRAHRVPWSDVLREAVEAELRRRRRADILRSLQKKARVTPPGAGQRSVREDRDAD